MKWWWSPLCTWPTR